MEELTDTTTKDGLVIRRELSEMADTLGKIEQSGESRYLQVNSALVIPYPRTRPSFVIVAGVGVAPTQVANPWSLIVVFSRSEVDQDPMWPTRSGHFLEPIAETENCT